MLADFQSVVSPTENLQSKEEEMSPMSQDWRKSAALSPSETATGMTRGQAEKLLDMASHGLMKSAAFVGIVPAEIDEFVKGVGPDMRDIFVGLVERRFQAHIGRYIVPVNYGAENAIVSAIEANAFGYKYLGVDVANIPLIGTGEAVEQVREVGFGKIMYNRDLPEALKQKGIEAGFPNGYIFANPLTSLIYALKNPEKQVEAPRGILFYIGKRLCDLYLSADGDRRELRVGRGSPGIDWGGGVQFLVVPASAPVAVPA